MRSISWGRRAELDKLMRICRKHGLILIEDAAHSLGTRYQGRMVGSIADMTTMSFHPVKTVTAGEGGAVLTKDSDFNEKLHKCRTHGITRDMDRLYHKDIGGWYYEQQLLGYNYRITDMQAALCCSQLDKLERFAKRRKEITALYDRELAHIKEIMLPKEIPESDTVRAYLCDQAEAGRPESGQKGHIRCAASGKHRHKRPLYPRIPPAVL